MTDEIEYGPDANSVRAHAKKMCTALEYDRKYNRLAYYQPSPKQLKFHNSRFVEKMIRAGNQEGKTHCAGAEVAMQACALWPNWFKGYRFDQPPLIERPHSFVGWCAAPTADKVRDGMQLKLLGDIAQPGGLGQGLIPLDFITGKLTMSRGLSNLVDTVPLRREIGGTAQIKFLSYQQGREAFGGASVDLIELDEDLGYPPYDEIYAECLSRITTTRGRIMVSMTPHMGKTPLFRRYTENPDKCEIVRMSLHDAIGFAVKAEDVEAIISRTPEKERATRIYGEPSSGEGQVFTTDPDYIKFNRDPSTFPGHWRWIAGIDFSHSTGASAHPFSWVLACYDVDSKTIYITHALRLKGMTPAQHASIIRNNVMWETPVLWPHDGNVAQLGGSETLMALYKHEGLNMRPEHTTFPDGGYGLDAGVQVMAEMFENGKLKIASYLAEVFEEIAGYHRVHEKIVSIDDDLLSAIRQVVMGVRFAREASEFQNSGTHDRFGRYVPTFPRRQKASSYTAIGTNDNPLDWSRGQSDDPIANSRQRRTRGGSYQADGTDFDPHDA